MTLYEGVQHYKERTSMKRLSTLRINRSKVGSWSSHSVYWRKIWYGASPYIPVYAAILDRIWFNVRGLVRGASLNYITLKRNKGE